MNLLLGKPSYARTRWLASVGLGRYIDYSLPRPQVQRRQADPRLHALSVAIVAARNAGEPDEPLLRQRYGLLRELLGPRRMGAPPKPELVTVGSLVLQAEMRRAWVAGRQIYRHEGRPGRWWPLLRQFVRHFGQPVSHRDLIQAAWRYDPGPLSYAPLNLRAVVNRLRVVLEATGELRLDNVKTFGFVLSLVESDRGAR